MPTGRIGSFEGGTWLIELGTSKGVIQVDFIIAATPRDIAAQMVGRGETANLGSGLSIPWRFERQPAAQNRRLMSFAGRVPTIPGYVGRAIPSIRVQSQKSRFEFLTFLVEPSSRQNDPSKIRE
jgi:hypothetical protein